MEYMNNMFKRMDLQQISGFLLNGTATHVVEEAKSYHDRLTESTAPLLQRIENIYPDIIPRDEATSEFFNALSVHKEIYMEIGMKAGAQLIYQLLLTGDISKSDK